MKKTLITIIVPIYNVEKTIRKCLDSIIAQTYSYWECILVDDGSNDASGSICDMYSSKDTRFKVIHKENGGVSSARQIGVDYAKGEYTIHVDPDDWVEQNMIENMASTAIRDNSDFIFCDYIVEKTNEVYNKVQKPNSLNPTVVLKEIIEGKLIGACWNKLIRTSYYKHSSFPLGINYSEDVIVMIQILKENPKISYIPEAYYHYMQYGNENSIINTNKKRLFENKYKFLTKMSEMCSYSEYSYGFDYRYADLVISASKLNYFSKKEYRSFIKDISKKSNFVTVINLKWRILILIKYYFDNTIINWMIKY